MAKSKRFDPFGKGYDLPRAKQAGLKPVASGKNKGHLGSLDPRDGTLLKGRRHESYTQALAVEELRGSTLKFDTRKGRYRSVPQKQNAIKKRTK